MKPQEGPLYQLDGWQGKATATPKATKHSNE